MARSLEDELFLGVSGVQTLLTRFKSGEFSDSQSLTHKIEVLLRDLKYRGDVVVTDPIFYEAIHTFLISGSKVRFGEYFLQFVDRVMEFRINSAKNKKRKAELILKKRSILEWGAKSNLLLSRFIVTYIDLKNLRQKIK